MSRELRALKVRKELVEQLKTLAGSYHNPHLPPGLSITVRSMAELALERGIASIKAEQEARDKPASSSSGTAEIPVTPRDTPQPRKKPRSKKKPLPAGKTGAAARLLDLVAEGQAQGGKVSWKKIAETLTAEGHTTARGKPWKADNVRREWKKFQGDGQEKPSSGGEGPLLEE